MDTSVVILEFRPAISFKDCNESRVTSLASRFDTFTVYVCRSPVVSVSPFTSVVIREVSVASPVVRRLDTLFTLRLVWVSSVVTRVDRLLKDVDKVDTLVLVTVFRSITFSST